MYSLLIFREQRFFDIQIQAMFHFYANEFEQREPKNIAFNFAKCISIETATEIDLELS